MKRKRFGAVVLDAVVIVLVLKAWSAYLLPITSDWTMSCFFLKTIEYSQGLMMIALFLQTPLCGILAIGGYLVWRWKASGRLPTPGDCFFFRQNTKEQWGEAAATYGYLAWELIQAPIALFFWLLIISVPMLLLDLRWDGAVGDTVFGQGIAWQIIALSVTILVQVILPRRLCCKRSHDSDKACHSAMYRRRGRAVCLSIGTLLLTFALYLVLWAGVAALYEPRIAQLASDLNADGLPTDWREAFPLPPAGDTGAKYTDRISLDIPKRLVSVAPDSFAELQPSIIAFLDSCHDTFLQADRALGCESFCPVETDSSEWVRYGVPCFPLPHYFNLIRLVRAYSLGSQQAAYSGQWSRASSYADSMIRCSQLAQSDPSVIAGVVGMFCRNTAIEMQVKIAILCRDDAQSYSFSKQVYDRLPAYPEDQARKIVLPEFVLYRTRATGELSRSESIWEQLRKNLYEPVHHYHCLRMIQYDWQMTAPGVTRQRWLDLCRERQAFRSSHINMMTWLAVGMAPDLGAIGRKVLDSNAKRGAAQLFTSILEYRRRHGHYPATLSALVPEFYPELPKNPFDGGDYEYVLTPLRLSLYALFMESDTGLAYTTIAIHRKAIPNLTDCQR